MYPTIPFLRDYVSINVSLNLIYFLNQYDYKPISQKGLSTLSFPFPELYLHTNGKNTLWLPRNIELFLFLLSSFSASVSLSPLCLDIP